MQAVLVVVVAALLSLTVILLPLLYLSGAAVALVTLRMGVQQGLQLVLWSSLLAAGFGLLLWQEPMEGAMFAPVIWLPVWAMAVSLRRTARPARSLVLAGLFGVMTVLAMHYVTGDPVQWWNEQLHEMFKQAMTSVSEVERAQVSQALEAYAGLLTGVAGAFLTASLIGSLMLGRWWQGLLFNPGGFGEEFRRIHLGRALVVFVFALLVLMSLAPPQTLYQDMTMVLMVPLAMQGIAVMHAMVKQRSGQNGWLIAMYVLLFIATGPMVLILAFAGAADNWFDFRKFSGPDGGAG